MNLNEVGGGQRGACRRGRRSFQPDVRANTRSVSHSVIAAFEKIFIHSSIHPFSSVTTGSYTRVDPGPSSENEGIQGRYPHRIDDRGSTRRLPPPLPLPLLRMFKTTTLLTSWLSLLVGFDHDPPIEHPLLRSSHAQTLTLTLTLASSDRCARRHARV